MTSKKTRQSKPQTRKAKARKPRRSPKTNHSKESALQNEATTPDLYSGSDTGLLSNFRLAALKHADQIARDNPWLRHEATTRDLYSGNDTGLLSNFRLAALKHAEQMSVPETYTNNWVQLGPTAIPYGQAEAYSRILVTGRITSIVIDPTNPNVIYVGAAQGGVWKTMDGGRNWIATSDQARSLAIGALAIDPKNAGILYAGTGEGNYLLKPSYYGCGVLKTTDGGKNWKLRGGGEGNNSILNGSRFFRLVVSPLQTSTIFAATTFGVYRSIDGGEEWTQMTKDLPKITNTIKAATDLVIDPHHPNIAYAAFWGAGIYKTENADNETPRWKRLASGLPIGGFTRVALGISQSSPQTVYALMANNDFMLDKFYVTNDGGSSWNPIQLPDTKIYDTTYKNSIGPQGYYNINVGVDPTTPDTVFLSGMTILKAFRNPITNIWGFLDIGKNIHPDHHAFAFHPTDNFVVYDGSDGGIYKSNDGGIAWNDTINEGLCITQFEFLDQHPESDAVIIAGTQDNGTEQFRNNSAFYHSADGDGGFVAVDSNEPNIVLHEYYNPSPERSEQGGKFDDILNGGSWKDVSIGLDGDSKQRTSLFYPPFALDQSNPRNIAFGTYKIFLDDNQGENGWTINTPSLPNLPWWEVVSAINYVNSNLIYVGTIAGKVFCLTKKDGKWAAKAIHNSTIPSLYIWDIATYPGRDNIIFMAMGAPVSNNEPRVWRGEVPADGVAQWTSISGKEQDSSLPPNTPVNAIVIEPENPKTMYVGTDIGVFYTTNSGESWARFGKGLPNCAVHDMRLHNATRLLRAATFGRGMWEIKLDAKTSAEVDVYVRDHLMDTGRLAPSPSGVRATFEDQLQNVKLKEKLFWWMCADIKVDPPFYQMNIDEVDYVKFEYRLRHRNLQRERENRIYIQVHNRGIKSANNVTVKIFYANLPNIPADPSQSPVLPDLPSDFWTTFHSDTPVSSSTWTQIGEAKNLPSGPKTLTHTEPTILAWEWKVPQNTADRIGVLVVVDSPEDPIPDTNKVFSDNIEKLVRSEKHIGLRVVDVTSV
jgi:hypothetical protein